MLNRRSFIAALVAGTCATAWPAGAKKPEAGLRGSFDVADNGLRPDSGADQSRVLQRLLQAAATDGSPVHLAAGDYVVSNIDLPEGAHLIGVPGATRLIQGRSGFFLRAQDLKRLSITGVTLDGAERALPQDIKGLLHLQGIADLSIDDCTVVNAARHGIYAEACGGRIADSRLERAAQAGLYAVDSTGLSITGNTVADCGNGGILVHRWEAGEDTTIVSGNRISRIAARDGGTGENGNGINIYRAANVMVTGNHISDCAFSAIRANAGSDVQITANQCLRSGETAIYSEFGFQGALVSANLIDGAANGILIVNFDEGGRLATVSDNIVRNLHIHGPYVHDGAGFGFGIAAEADTVISGNVIENAPKWGLMLGWGPYMRNIVATGNLIRSAGGGCAVTVVEEAGTALISDNLFAEVRDGAILGYRWNEKATGDLIAGGSEAFAHLTLSNNRLA